MIGFQRTLHPPFPSPGWRGRVLLRVAFGLALMSFLFLSFQGCGLPFFKRRKGLAGRERDVPVFSANDGWMNVSSRPYRMVLYFNGKVRYLEDGSPLATPAIVRLSPGRYELKLKLQGYREWCDTVPVFRQETTQVNVVLDPLWTEEGFRKQEKYALIVGGTILALLTVLGLTWRKIH